MRITEGVDVKHVDIGGREQSVLDELNWVSGHSMKKGLTGNLRK